MSYPWVNTMTIDSYFLTSLLKEKSTEQNSTDRALEEIINSPSRILNKKLEILSAEIWWRLHLASKNLSDLDANKSNLQEMLNKLDRSAIYHLREHQEKGIFYRKLFDIETEKRSQQVECWRDVVMVMKDFLFFWEAHEKAQSRAVFINHAGPRT